MKKVLVLGAGLVARPLVRYLLETAGYRVTVASRTVSKAEKLIAGHANGRALQLLATETERIDPLVAEHDLTVSLLPYAHHVSVAKMCIAHGKHMVTTSYVSDAMKALDGEARGAGISILNEIGVDPGIDHMSAMRIIHGVRAKGGKIVEFRSYCGGLPALEANTNPFGYKFSWSPKGVLLAARNNGRYLENGAEVKVPGPSLFAHYHFLDVKGPGCFEAYVNRDSYPYIELYGLESVRSMSRWTLRNVSHCETWKQLVDLGYFDAEEIDVAGLTYAGLARRIAGAAADADPAEAVRAKLGLPEAAVVLRKMRWLGLFDETPLPVAKAAPLDILADLMLGRLTYAEGEQDLIVLHHNFRAEFPDHEEKITSTLVALGEVGGDSAMARTVSLPAAIGVHLILEGKIERRGVFIPVLPEVYEPCLAELERLGITCVEEATPLS
jgi:saccharopine dehydrogenase-like NADP-dependent oxidoreductase